MDIDDLARYLYRIDARLHKVERLVWIAVGGIAVIGGLLILVSGRG